MLTKFAIIFSFAFLSFSTFAQLEPKSGIVVERVNEIEKQNKAQNQDTSKVANSPTTNVNGSIVSNAKEGCFKAENFFVKKDEKSGREFYLNPYSGGMIQIVHFSNVQYNDFCEAMNEKYYKENQLKYISTEAFKNESGIEGKIYKVSYVFKEKLHYRYIIYAGQGTEMLWLTLTGNEASDPSAKKTIEEIKKSITLAPYKR